MVLGGGRLDEDGPLYHQRSLSDTDLYVFYVGEWKQVLEIQHV